jgi:thiol-disulfide isomerase/thioredoxin
MKARKLFSATNKSLTFLSKEDFDMQDFFYIKSNAGKVGMLFVYKDNCPFCVPLVKVITTLAKEFSKLNLPFYLANQTEEKYLTMKTVPAFYFVNNDNSIRQMTVAKRTAHDILYDFIRELSTGPPQKKLYNSLYNDSHNVVQLTNDNFDINGYINADINAINSSLPNKAGILKAYANWCIFCKLKTGLIETIAKENNATSVYVIDLAENQNNPLNPMVSGYPTFLLVSSDGHVHEIKNKETTEQLLNADTGISPSQKSELIYAINSVMN